MQRLEQALQWYGLPGRRGPEDGLPGPSRGLISLEEDRVRSLAIASVRRSGWATSGGFGTCSKERRACRQEKGPEGGNPRSGPVGNHGKARRGARRREGERTLRTQGAGGVEAVGESGPFLLATAVGSRTSERDSADVGRTRVKARGAGVGRRSNPEGE